LFCSKARKLHPDILSFNLHISTAHELVVDDVVVADVEIVEAMAFTVPGL
jgi:hypothetical protein